MDLRRSAPRADRRVWWVAMVAVAVVVAVVAVAVAVAVASGLVFG
ncbi:hypothetical protein [Streptomyces sp. XY431]|nr:hypothetical protein [Streptomyces sp. XY431]